MELGFANITLWILIFCHIFYNIHGEKLQKITRGKIPEQSEHSLKFDQLSLSPNHSLEQISPFNGGSSGPIMEPKRFQVFYYRRRRNSLESLKNSLEGRGGFTYLKPEELDRIGNNKTIKSTSSTLSDPTLESSFLSRASNNGLFPTIKSVQNLESMSTSPISEDLEQPQRDPKTSKRAISPDEKDEEVPVHKRTSVQYSSLVGPSFVNTSFYDQVYALVGQEAKLNCFVKNLHNYTVSWIRGRDINLLTSGEVAYSSDKRFAAINPAKGLQWSLKIGDSKISDSGNYLCQISTSPPISTPVFLTVTKSEAKVYPASEMFLKVGSPVRLICTITGCPYPSMPYWHKGQRIQKDLIIEETTLAFVPIRRAVPTSSDANDTLEVSIEDIQPVLEEVLLARVVLERPQATLELSGTYTCTNACTEPVNLTLHVLSGDEETAAMQHINRSFCFRYNKRLWMGSTAILLLVNWIYFRLIFL